VNMSKAPQSKEPGAAIVLVVLAVVILFLMGVGLLSLGLRSRMLAIRTASGIKARCAADAGLTKAVFEMNEKLKTKPWDSSTLPEADEQLFDATFSYTVTGDIGSGYIIESIGRSGQAEKRVYAEIELQGLFEISILTQGDLVLKSNTLIGGYNSLDPNDTDVEVKIATSSVLADGIVLNSGVVVDGDVLVGVGGDVDMVIKDLGGTTGARYPMLEEPVFPEVTPPELADKGNIELENGGTRTINPADSGEYTEIILKNDAILKIDGEDVVLYVTGDIDLGQDSEIKIEEGASLTLYLDGDFEAGNSAGINNKNSPTKFKLYGTGEAGQCLDLKAKSENFGAVYAPDAVIIVRADGDVYGSLVAEELEFKAGSDFYYDEALRNVGVDDEGVRFVIKGWREE